MKWLVPFLLMFTLAVGAAGEFTLIGTPPSEREDNTVLDVTEISGFNVHCGLSVGSYTDTMFYPGATLPTTSWIVLDRPVGTSYCVVTTMDEDGRESVHSNYITLVNNGKALPKSPWISPGQTLVEVTTLP